MNVQQAVATLVILAALPVVAQTRPKPSASDLGNVHVAGSDAGVPSPSPSAPARAAPSPSPTATPAATAPANAAASPTPAALPPELAELRLFLGTWRCLGTVPATALGPARKTDAIAKVTASLDGAWTEFRYEQRKTPENPMPLKLTMLWGYDRPAKQFHRVAHSNLGTWDMGTSPGWQQDTLVWTGETGGLLGKIPFRNQVTRRSPRELVLTTEYQVQGQWLSIGTDVCKR
jgi:hypothetical protein